MSTPTDIEWIVWGVLLVLIGVGLILTSHDERRRRDR